MIEVSAGVFYPDAAPVLLDGTSVDQVRTAAARSSLSRARFCAHESAVAVVQEMLIVQTYASYVRPHRHPGRAESLLLLEGELDALFFHADGSLGGCHRMRSYGRGGPFYYRIPPLTWHSIVILSPQIVMQEVTQGPFRPEDSEFAPWAPSMDDVGGVTSFLSELRTTSTV